MLKLLSLGIVRPADAIQEAAVRFKGLLTDSLSRGPLASSIANRSRSLFLVLCCPLTSCGKTASSNLLGNP